MNGFAFHPSSKIPSREKSICRETRREKVSGEAQDGMTGIPGVVPVGVCYHTHQSSGIP
jgi:hypothetical protein